MDVLRDSTFSSFEIYMDYNSMEIEGKKMKKNFLQKSHTFLPKCYLPIPTDPFRYFGYQIVATLSYKLKHKLFIICHMLTT